MNYRWNKQVNITRLPPEVPKGVGRLFKCRLKTCVNNTPPFFLYVCNVIDNRYVILQLIRASPLLFSSSHRSRWMRVAFKKSIKKSSISQGLSKVPSPTRPLVLKTWFMQMILCKFLFPSICYSRNGNCMGDLQISFCSNQIRA